MWLCSSLARAKHQGRRHASFHSCKQSFPWLAEESFCSHKPSFWMRLQLEICRVKKTVQLQSSGDGAWNSNTSWTTRTRFGFTFRVMEDSYVQVVSGENRRTWRKIAQKRCVLAFWYYFVVVWKTRWGDVSCLASIILADKPTFNGSLFCQLRLHTLRIEDFDGFCERQKLVRGTSHWVDFAAEAGAHIKQDSCVWLCVLGWKFRHKTCTCKLNVKKSFETLYGLGLALLSLEVVVCRLNGTSPSPWRVVREYISLFARELTERKQV